MSVLVTRKSFKKHKAHHGPSFAAQALNHPALMLGNTYKLSSFYYTFYYFYGSELSTECEHNLKCITL